MMELSEEFVKLMQIGLMVIGLLAIFIIFISYNVNLEHNKSEREAYVLGEYLLGSKCLASTDSSGNAIKSMFNETKLDNIVVDHSCIKYSSGKIEVNLIDLSKNWVFELKNGATYIGKNATFIVSVKTNAGDIKPAQMTVTV